MPTTSFSSFDSYTVAEVVFDPNEIRGIEDLASSRLVLPLKFVLRSGGDRTRSDLLFDGVAADLGIQGGQYIASASPVRMCSFRKAEWTVEDRPTVSVEFPLSPRQIEAIERIRSGGPNFRISLWMRVTSLGDREREGFQLRNSLGVVAELTFTVPESIWRERVLSELGFGKVRVIELPEVGFKTWAGMEQSFIALERAQQHLKAGLYDDAAAMCRIALDPFFGPVDKGDGKGPRSGLKPEWEMKLGHATYTWLEGCLRPLRQATNAVHHKASTHFDRFEVQMLLMIATAVISYAAREADATAASST